MRGVFRNTKYVLAFLVLTFLSAVYSAFATPPASRYIPGETLDPTCAPGDAECSVIPINIGDEIGSGNAASVLFIDDTGLLGEDNTNFLYDVSSRYLYSDNLALANNLEITTTTSSNVGVISKDSVRFIHTYKPAGTNDNLFIGKTSGNFTLSATSNLNGNVGIGQNALTNLSSGYFNTILGAYAGNSVTTGFSNVFIGTQASRNNATGLRNVAIGDAALYGSGHTNHSSTDNVSIGQSSMYFTSTSARNISIGTEAGYNSSSASDNVFIGYQSGHDITTESGNIFIGYLSGSDATGSNKLYIENSASESPLIYGDFASDLVAINGKLGIGDSSPAAALTVGSGDLFQVTSSGIARAPSASAGVPAYSFTADTDTGIYLANDGEIGFAVASTVKGKITNQGILAPDGGVALPGLSFIDNNDTGLFNPGSGIGFSVDGVQIAILDTDGILDFDDGGIDLPVTTNNVSGVIKQAGSVIYHSSGSDDNIFFGKNAGNFSVTGTENIVVGASSGVNLSSGSHNVALGLASIQGLTNGSYNTAIGYLAGQNLSSGSNNIFIGASLGTTDDFTMSNSVIIGNNYVPTDDTFDANTNILVIDGDISATPLVYGDFTLNTFSINGDFGVGDATPDYLVDIEDISVDTDIFALTDNDGSCLHDPEAGAETVTCSSDERLKQNIVNAGDILPYFRGFNIREYDVLASGDHMFGVIAQEVNQVYPELVKVGANGFYTVEIPSSWEIIKAIQELDIDVSDITTLDINDENSFANVLVTWFADAANGIGRLFAKEIHTDMLCVGDTCVTEEEFLQLLGSDDVQTYDNDDMGPLPEEEPPVEDGSDDQPVQPDDQIEEDESSSEQNTETDNESSSGGEDTGSSEPGTSEV